MNLKNLLTSSYSVFVSIKTGLNLLVHMVQEKLPKQLVKITSVCQPYHAMPPKNSLICQSGTCHGAVAGSKRRRRAGYITQGHAVESHVIPRSEEGEVKICASFHSRGEERQVSEKEQGMSCCQFPGSCFELLHLIGPAPVIKENETVI